MPHDGPATAIRAAGGLVWRHGPGGAEVCLVHRPRYDDWTLPKGKLRRGEHPLAAAVREVHEETGLRARPRMALPTSRYRVGGVPKEVAYWAMVVRPDGRARARPGTPVGSEVDEIAWLPAAAAARRLRYPGEVAVLEAWRALPEVTGVVLLVRHADAGDRDSRPDRDDARTLSRTGSADATALCDLLALFAPGLLVSAPPRRCGQTLAPLAERTGLAVETVAALDERTAEVAAVARRLADVAADRDCSVVCAQGDLIARLLAYLTATPDDGRWRTGKADGWLVPFSGTSPLPPAPLAVRS